MSGLSLLFFSTGIIKYQKAKRIVKQTIKDKKDVEKKYKLLFDSISDTIFVCDLTGNITEVNQASCNILGYDRNTLLQKNILQIISEKFKAATKEKMTLTSENKENTYETEYKTQKGKIIPVEMKSQKVKINGQTMIMSIGRNIKQRKLLEKKIISTVINTEQKERKKFAADLHDELGPILSTIKLYSNLLLDKDIQDKKIKTIIKDIDNIADLAITTAKDLQNRITPTILQDFGLASAISEFCNYIKKAKSIDIKLNTAEYSPAKDKFVETVIFQICKELINNTLKHAEASEINIELKSKNNQIIFYYRDNGKGFDVNKNLENSQGIGLNNIITKIKTINGQCDFFSRQGKGMFVLIAIKIKQ